MGRGHDVWRRIKNLGRQSQAQRERDLEREIQNHLELETAEFGERGARIVFGNTALVKEDVREAWGWARWEQFRRDVH